MFLCSLKLPRVDRGEQRGHLVGFCVKKNVKFFLLIFFSKFFFFNWTLYPNHLTLTNFNRPILVGGALGNSYG